MAFEGLSDTEGCRNPPAYRVKPGTAVSRLSFKSMNFAWAALSMAYLRAIKIKRN